MLVNHHQRKIFLHNPKCGGIALTTFLMDHGYEPLCDPMIELDYGVIARHAYIVPAELSTYHTWCTVRHPYSRTLSYWRYYVEQKLCDEMPLIEWIEQHTTYMMRQAWYVRASREILRLENLATDQRFNGLRRENESSSQHYVSELTQVARSLIYNIFEEDFEATGYRK